MRWASSTKTRSHCERERLSTTSSRFCPVQRSDDLSLVLPGIRAVGGCEVHASNRLEALVEPIQHFSLPLEHQVGRTYDQDAADQAARLQFLEQEARHDGLSSPGVVGEQEADARRFEKEVIDGF